MRSLIRHVICGVLAVTFMATAVRAQTGKIEGVVTDAASGAPLPGVNVVVDGTTQGASSDADGYYAILNVPPGTHTLVASFVGFETQQIQNVRVNIDLTTTVDIQMREEAVGLEEVVVRAREPVVKRDVSADRCSSVHADSGWRGAPNRCRAHAVQPEQRVHGDGRGTADQEVRRAR